MMSIVASNSSSAVLTNPFNGLAFPNSVPKSARDRSISGFFASHCAFASSRAWRQRSAASVRTCDASINWSGEYFMGLPFRRELWNLHCVPTGNPAPFPTHRQNRHRGLSVCGLPCNVDASVTSGRSLSGAGAVGGLFCRGVRGHLHTAILFRCLDKE